MARGQTAPSGNSEDKSKSNSNSEEVKAESKVDGKTISIADLTAVYKLLSDETRLRILSLLGEGELAVGELQRILGIGQSTLSTQLGLLKDLDLVASHKEGQKVYYRIPDTLRTAPKQAIVANALANVGSARWHSRDRRALEKVLESRAEATRIFFNTQAVQNLSSPGQTWKALCQGLIRLTRGQRIVDLGCGNGRLALLFAEAGNQVTGIDSSDAQIRLAKENAGKQLHLLEFKSAAMEETGLASATFDLAILSQSLHHAANPRQAVAEAYRLLVPGGRLLLLDLLAHDAEWMRGKFGDFWLGFSEDDLRQWLSEAGFVVVQSEITPPSKVHPEIEGLLIVAEKMGAEKIVAEKTVIEKK